jgi:hypothetical protein
MTNKAGTADFPLADRSEPNRPSGDPRRHNLLMALLLLPPLLILAVASFLLEPLRGDLTRLGGYAENQYGWTKPQVRFEPPLVETGPYNRPYEIVVLGDSFSSSPYGTDQTDPGVYWTNHLAQRTGMSVLSLNMFKHGLDAVLANPHFQADPPRLFVLQIVESMLGLYFVEDAHGYLGSTDAACKATAASATTGDPGRLAPVASATTQPWERDRSRGFVFDQAVNFIWKTLRRNAFGADAGGIHSLALTRADLFSSRAADRLLVHGRDFEKASWSEATVRKLRCNLIEAQGRVEANGKTRFLLMVAPDKLTIYEGYLADPAYRGLSRLSTLFADTGIRTVDLRRPLQRALDCGVVDLYLPNDTHWSSSGHAVAADAVLAAYGFHADPRSAAVPPLPQTCRTAVSFGTGEAELEERPEGAAASLHDSGSTACGSCRAIAARAPVS